MSAWNENLPDSSQWQPRKDAAESLRQLFFKRCQSVEKQIVFRADAEKIGRIDNFDPGPGTEDIVREELAKLLPGRYAVRAGTIDDTDGHTAGDFDVIVFNEVWFPSVRAGATKVSRKFHYPIEGVYSVIEVKTSLSFKSLDEAMEKLVACHRLKRPPVIGPRYTENRCTNGFPTSINNPLYSAILAVGLAEGVSLDDVVNRFLSISEKLNLRELVRGLCVLQEGFLSWGERLPGSGSKPALFHEQEPVVPILHDGRKIQSGFYPFINDLVLQLYHSVLGPEDLTTAYGLGSYDVRVPKDPKRQYGLP